MASHFTKYKRITLTAVIEDRLGRQEQKWEDQFGGQRNNSGK